jgi:hypothetical protein
MFKFMKPSGLKTVIFLPFLKISERLFDICKGNLFRYLHLKLKYMILLVI